MFGFGNMPSLAQRGQMLAAEAPANPARMPAPGGAGFALPSLPGVGNKTAAGGGQLSPVAPPQTVGAVEAQAAPAAADGLTSTADMMAQGGGGGGIEEILAALFGG